jgi:16S rRNA (cytosine1402-N4)-methyltransferase
MKESYDYHVPVLLEEVIRLLACKSDGVYFDGTLGGGGHFKALAAELATGGTLIGIDRDPEAILWNRATLPPCRATVIIEQSPFSEFDTVLKHHHITSFDGCLLDLGVSSHQIDSQDRGFSYLQQASLDMRMNPQQGIPAHALIRRSSETELATILRDYGEVEGASRIARAVKNWKRPIETSVDLRECCTQIFGNRLPIKLLAKIFQALRIAVNDELGELKRFLAKVLDFMKPGSRLAIISYHSLEDRMVKEFMRGHERACICPPEAPLCVCSRSPIFKRLTKKALRPSTLETDRNRRSRSARLRVVERTEASR